MWQDRRPEPLVPHEVNPYPEEFQPNPEEKHQPIQGDRQDHRGNADIKHTSSEASNLGLKKEENPE